jgi:hypothetical protein
MGLDQVWITLEKDSDKEMTLYYHRKVDALESFMARTWASMPENAGKVFNSEKLYITLDILEALRAHIARNTFNIPEGHRKGFAGIHLSPEDEAEVIEAIEEAETAIEDRDATVYYTSSW